MRLLPPPSTRPSRPRPRLPIKDILMSNFDFDLSQFDDDYAAAPVERENEPVPDGKYQVIVHKVELARSKQSDQPMLKWQLKVIAPNYVGRLVFRNNMLASAENIRWLKQDLFTCGLELAKLSELPANLTKLLDVGLEITVKTKDEFSNVYLNRRINVPDVAAAPLSNAGPLANMDMLPF
jgi:hypothetical protein